MNQFGWSFPYLFLSMVLSLTAGPYILTLIDIELIGLKYGFTKHSFFFAFLFDGMPADFGACWWFCCTELFVKNTIVEDFSVHWFIIYYEPWSIAWLIALWFFCEVK